ncbi:hypothetical protein [Dactylosporangium sp. CS-033363]|uniref:hypothetical protein n=1 Tax=Dactylosporangium sp. CS-033363 TaxID=3239935 RepID=UPI003D8F7E94
MAADRVNDAADPATDPAIRELVEYNDPTRGRPIPPPRMTAAELRARAGGPAHSRRTSLIRWLAPAGALVATGLVVVAVQVTHQPVREEPAAAPAMLTGLLTDAEAAPAGARLRRLAGDVAALREPAPDGPNACIRTQQWPAKDHAADPGVVAVDEQLCWTPNHDGRRRITVLPPQPPGQLRAGGTGALNPADASIEPFTAGQISYLTDVPVGDEAIVAGQLTSYPPADHQPSTPLQAVADMNRYHILDPAQRAAILRVLANDPGISFRGIVTDRDGRTGAAYTADVTHDDGPVRDIAVIDEQTGRLLSYERVALLTPSADGRRSPTVLSYVLYLAEDWTDQLD